jgi:hypothetical protein
MVGKTLHIKLCTTWIFRGKTRGQRSNNEFMDGNKNLANCAVYCEKYVGLT